jgi:hypothetical protein
MGLIVLSKCTFAWQTRSLDATILNSTHMTNIFFSVRFQVLTAATMKYRVFWDVLPCSQIILLSLFFYGPPTHLPLAQFLTYRYPFPIGQPIPLGLLYNQLSVRARLTHRPDDGGSTHLWNVGQHLFYYTAVGYITDDSKLHIFLCWACFVHISESGFFIRPVSLNILSFLRYLNPFPQFRAYLGFILIRLLDPLYKRNINDYTSLLFSTLASLIKWGDDWVLWTWKEWRGNCRGSLEYEKPQLELVIEKCASDTFFRNRYYWRK